MKEKKHKTKVKNERKQSKERKLKMAEKLEKKSGKKIIINCVAFELEDDQYLINSSNIEIPCFVS